MRIRSEILAVVAMGAAGAFAQDYPTPSFDCANIMTPQELRICRSQELSELDGRHGSLVDAYASHIRELERIVPAVLPQPAFTAPMLRDIVSAVANAAPAPVKPAAPRTGPPPEPVTTEDDGEDEAWPAYVIAIALAGLALVVWGVFRVARRTRVNASGERDASGDRP
jgi:hypothetical protein